MDNLKRVLPNSADFYAQSAGVGFTPDFRDVINHWIMKDHKALALWISLKAMSSFAEHSVKFKGSIYYLSPGELVSSITELMKITGLTKKVVESRLKLLAEHGMISAKGEGRGTVITVCLSSPYSRFRPGKRIKKEKVRGRLGEGMEKVRGKSPSEVPVFTGVTGPHNTVDTVDTVELYIDSDNFSEEKKESGDRIISHALQSDEEKILSEGNTEQISIEEVRKELQKFESLRGCDSVHYFERVKVWCLEKGKLSNSKGYKLSKVIQFALNDSKRGELVIVGQKPSGSGRSEANSLPDDFGIRSPKAVKMPDSLVRKITE